MSQSLQRQTATRGLVTIKIQNVPCDNVYITTHADSRSAWVASSAPSVCLSVCPEHNSKKNDLKVFKLDTGNELRIS